MPIKVSMISLGCPKNQVDAEGMLAKLKSPGFRLTQYAALSDVVIINTCGFIEDAKKESIENILEMAQLKDEGTIKGIVVTGCLSQRYFNEMQVEFPEVNCILQVGCAGDIEKAVVAAYNGEKLNLEADPEQLDLGIERVVTTLPFYAYLKIAEDCDNGCTYCVIPSLRGRYRSRPIEELVAEAEKLSLTGVRELVLVAQDTTRYGVDLYGRLMLSELLLRLCGISGLKWIRLLYCYPDYINDELIDTIAENEKIVKYLDIPIQHVNERILTAMNRYMGKKALTALIDKLRTRIPGVTLRTTLIVGFPGETQAEFEELAEFVKEIKFEHLGAFAYSREEGTPAASFDGQLKEELKQHRQEIVMTEQQMIVGYYNTAMQGKTVEVLTEGFDRDAECYFGRTASDAPDIDGKVFFASVKKLRPGDFVSVLINDIYGDDLYGVAVKDEANTGSN